jgi:hypothetical protein
VEVTNEQSERAGAGTRVHDDYRKRYWAKRLERFLAIASQAEAEHDYFMAGRAFVSVRVIAQVLHRLEFEVAQHQEGASLYDLYNSMSFLGTHNRTLSDTYRTRLRLGAGEFSRHEPRICGACRQLLLDNDHETTTG